MLVDTTRVASAAGGNFGSVSNTTANVPNNWGTVSQSTPFPSQVGGTPLSYTFYQWESRSTAGSAIFPFVSDSIVRSYTLEGRFDRKELSRNHYDGFGNLTSSIVSVYAVDGGAVFARQAMANTYINNASN